MDYDLPKDVKVNLIVALDQPVSQAHDLRSRNLRKVRTLFLGYTVGRLANYLEQAHKSEIKQAVLIQVGAFSAVDHVDGLPRMVQHLLQRQASVTGWRIVPRLRRAPAGGSTG